MTDLQLETQKEKITPTAKKTKSERMKISAESFPRRTLEESLKIPEVLHKTYAGKSATLEEIAAALGIGVKSPNIRYLIWAAQAYGLVQKEGDYYSLAETGRKIIAPNYEDEDSEAKVKSLLTPAILSKFYNDYNGHPFPAEIHLKNILENRFNIPRERINEAEEILVANANFVGILHFEGNDRIVNLSKVQKTKAEVQISHKEFVEDETDEKTVGGKKTEWDNTIFFVTPIGEEGSENRKHSDMMLRHLLEPTADEFKLKVIRADKIERSGIITQQIYEHIVRCRICIVDLSFNNPNVFYELGIRHMTKLPTIQLIRKVDRIPFDVSQSRTIIIDTSDIYTIIDRFASARRELSEHIKHILSNKESKTGDDNPVNVYLPMLKIELSR